MSKAHSVLDRLRLYRDQTAYARSNNRGFAHKHYEFYQAFLDRMVPRLGGSISGKRVLDVGCGKSYWFSLLLHNDGACVTGIDTEYVAPDFGLKKYLRLLADNGLERAAKTLYWDLFHSGTYYSELERLTGCKLSMRELDLRLADVTDIPFPFETFDLVVSHEVFEHLSDVAAALGEIRRVLKPRGLAYIYIHVYMSLSGGHHIKWKFPDTAPPDDVPPWDHLRQNLFPEIPSFINRLRLHEYRAMLEEKFDILDWVTIREGERFLTPELRQELADYSEEELLTKGVTVITRKPQDKV